MTTCTSCNRSLTGSPDHSSEHLTPTLGEFHNLQVTVHKLKDDLASEVKTRELAAQEAEAFEKTRGAGALTGQERLALSSITQVRQKVAELSGEVKRLKESSSSSCCSKVASFMIILIGIIAAVCLVTLILCMAGCLPSLSNLIMSSVIGTSLGSSTLLLLTLSAGSVALASLVTTILTLSKRNSGNKKSGCC